MQEDEFTTKEPEMMEEAGEALPPEPPTEPRGPSRVGRALRRGLQWVAGVGVVFLLGVLIVYFVRVQPQADQIKLLERNLDETQSEVETLQARIDQLEPLEEDIDQLEQELAVKDRHLDLLAVLVDVTSAQLGLAKGRPEMAASALENTDRRLESLQEGLEEREADTVQGMRDRLRLVLQEIATDEFAAENDLEILANNLVDLEAVLFND